jgi:hypothetical protein
MKKHTLAIGTIIKVEIVLERKWSTKEGKSNNDWRIVVVEKQSPYPLAVIIGHGFIQEGRASKWSDNDFGGEYGGTDYRCTKAIPCYKIRFFSGGREYRTPIDRLQVQEKMTVTDLDKTFRQRKTGWIFSTEQLRKEAKECRCPKCGRFQPSRVLIKENVIEYSCSKCGVITRKQWKPDEA